MPLTFRLAFLYIFIFFYYFNYKARVNVDDDDDHLPLLSDAGRQRNGTRIPICSQKKSGGPTKNYIYNR